MYFYLHIVSLLIILFLPIKPQAHNQRRPQTVNSVNKKKMDWYLHQKQKNAEHLRLQIIGQRLQSSPVTWRRCLHAFFFSCFCFLRAGSIFVSLFVPVNQPCPVDLTFYRRFEWHGGMWRKCQNLQRQCILGIWVFVSLPWSPAPEIWILGTWVSAPEVRRGSWDDLSSRIHPRWLCLGKPPVLRLVTLLFSNTLTILRRLPGRDCVREVCRILKTWWARSPTVNGHLYGLEVRHVPWRRLCPPPPHTPQQGM